MAKNSYNDTVHYLRVATKYGFGHLVDRFNLYPLWSVTDRVTKAQAVHPEISDPKRLRMISDEDIRTSLESKLSIAVSPLAVPLLAGPGTIATAL